MADKMIKTYTMVHYIVCIVKTKWKRMAGHAPAPNDRPTLKYGKINEKYENLSLKSIKKSM